MYLTKILSCNGAWDILNTEHVDVFLEIKEILKKFSPNIHDPAEWLSSDPPTYQFVHIPENFEHLFIENGWDYPLALVNFSIMRNLLGAVKQGISIKMDNNVDAITAFIFKRINKKNMGDDISLPILVTVTSSVIENRLRVTKNNAERISCTFESAHEDLINLLPENFSQRFLIFGIDDIDQEIELIEIDSKKAKVERSIEFKPEHYQAGLGILSYFGTVLRNKYPDQNATVKIEQNDLTVRMIIETNDGNTEVIEKALHEYELLLSGEVKPDEFYLSPIHVLEFKTQFRIFELQIESQRDIISLQKDMIIELKQLAMQALSQPPITVINQLQNTQTTTINHKAEFTKSNDELEDLIDLADSDALKNRLATIQNALEVNRNADQPEAVKDSNGMKKLAKFLKEANEVGTEANTLAEKGGKALDLIKSLGRSYNSLAQWCGMPVIPSVLVKE